MSARWEWSAVSLHQAELATMQALDLFDYIAQARSAYEHSPRSIANLADSKAFGNSPCSKSDWRRL